MGIGSNISYAKWKCLVTNIPLTPFAHAQNPRGKGELLYQIHLANAIFQRLYSLIYPLCSMSEMFSY